MTPWQFLKESTVSCAAALQFLTIVPPLVRRSFADRELGRATAFFPLVGLLLGGVLVGADLLLGLVWHGNGLHLALVLTLWVLLTGGLHVDGFLDSCDGLLGGRTADQRLEILRDPRVGSFAVIGGILLFLLKFTALAGCQQRTAALLLAPTLGRWCVAWAIVGFPYARPEGLGRALKDHAVWLDLGLATIIAGTAVMVSSFVLGPLIFAGMAATFLLTWLLAKFTMTRIPGLTGDIYGAICELTELAVLVFMTLPFMKFGEPGA